MRIKVLSLWQQLRSSYWFVPSVMTLGAFFLSWFMIEIDGRVGPKWLNYLSFISLNQPEGARALLSTVAGSMITVAGVSFSITMVALSLASQQFGPRLLRNFMRDTGNQIVLGTFIATFLYCLLVLRTITSTEGSSFVPYLAIFVAVILTVLSLGVFIYFIHHTAESIQVSAIVAKIGTEMSEAIKKQYQERQLFPELMGQSQGEAKDALDTYKPEPVHIATQKSGYLQAIDEIGLMTFAKKKRILLKLEHRPGDYIFQGRSLLLVYYSDATDLSLAELKEQIYEAFALGAYRSHAQDLGFLFNQLTEIALRALSPGINDPYTAMTCLDRITDGFLLLLQRDLPSAYRFDDEGQLRVIALTLDPKALFRQSYSPIRHYAKDNLLVNQKLLKVLFLLFEQSQDEAFKELIKAEASQVKEDACKVLSLQDCQDLTELYVDFNAS